MVNAKERGIDFRFKRLETILAGEPSEEIDPFGDSGAAGTSTERLLVMVIHICLQWRTSPSTRRVMASPAKADCNPLHHSPPKPRATIEVPDIVLTPKSEGRIHLLERRRRGLAAIFPCS
jgi:hypothetical protein